MGQFFCDHSRVVSRRALKGGVSAVAVCALMIAGPAWAQASAEGAGTGVAVSDDAIIVTGIRQSLSSAQSIKKNADTVLDSVTASDIGALPDRSVTEALQRVPGVAINRFAGSADPDHFSVEGSGVTIRGLDGVRSEFNGRDAFAAGVGGQAIGFADVPAELLGRMDIYKNSAADLIEGGLAGTVNLVTRKPFDRKGFHVAFDLEGNYGDFAKKWSPTSSGLLSNTWDTGIGEIGVLVSASWSQIYNRSDGIQVANFQTRDNTFVSPTVGAGFTGLMCRNALPSDADEYGNPVPAVTGNVNVGDACYNTGAAGANGMADTLDSAYAPIGGGFRTDNYNRKRQGLAGSLQWRSTDGRTLITAEFVRAHSSNDWDEHTWLTTSNTSEYNTYPLGCLFNSEGYALSNGASTVARCPAGSFTNYTYDSSNVFQSGYITYPGGAWRGGLPNLGDAVTTNALVPAGGMQQQLDWRQVHEDQTNIDASLNIKTDLTDRLHVNLDYAYAQSEHNYFDMMIGGSTFADEYLDLTGELPLITAHKPNTTAYSWATPNSTLAGMTDSEYFTSQQAQFWRSAMDHIEHSTGREYAVRGDVTYDFVDGSFFRDVQVGMRYADRMQTYRASQYNWGVLSELWGGGDGSPVSIAYAGSENATWYGFDNFFRGQAAPPPGGYYYNGELISGYDQAVAFAQDINAVWQTIGGGSGWVPAAARAGVVSGTPFLPSEIQPVSQQDYNAYVKLNFGGDRPVFSGIRLSGNVGVRLVHTDLRTSGIFTGPNVNALGLFDSNTSSVYNYSDFQTAACSGSTVLGFTVTTNPNWICGLNESQYNDLVTFSENGNVRDNAKNSYTYLLPSLNLKFGLSNDVIVRFAASKVMQRPETGKVRNYFNVFSGTGGLTLQRGNPYLKPTTAWQFDLTGEWYFSHVGSLTLDLFYKSVHNFFYDKMIPMTVTFNGVTQSVDALQPVNYSGYGKIKGFELAFQQVFTFLPKPLNGLGFKGSYTYVDSTGLPNSFINGNSFLPETTITPGNLPMANLSKHIVNLEVFYENSLISARAAYNWRSKFLLTPADAIAPYFPIYNGASGQLDASVLVNVTNNVKVGVQGVNLLNTLTKTYQDYGNPSGDLAFRSAFINDRRFSFIIRGGF